MNLSKKGQTVYSAEYVYSRLHPDASHKRKRKEVDAPSDESLKAFDDFCRKELEQPNRSLHQVTSSALDASEALLYLSESITKSSSLL